MAQTAKLFQNGQSQAVRLPKAFRFDADEVYIRQEGDDVILSVKKPSWGEVFKQESAFDDDFLLERDNEKPQERELF